MFGKRKKGRYAPLEKVIGYVFRDKSLLETALMHRSFRFENSGIESDNQRLEFLGDAVLGLVAAADIYGDFDDGDEGVLTRMRSGVTSGKALSKIAQGIDLGAQLSLGKGEEASGGRTRASNLADGLEAVVGAAYLDGGLGASEKIYRKLLRPELEASSSDEWAENPKGKLQELSQRRWRRSPEYRSQAEAGPPHARVFTIAVFIDGKEAGRAKGKSKQQAEVRAARAALKTLLEKHDSSADK